MDTVLRDAKHAFRMFRQAPGFTLAAIAALALAIAINTAIFPVVNAVLLRPLPYPDPARIVMFQNTFHDGARSGSASPVEYNWWKQHGASFQDIAAYEFNVANWTGLSLPEQVPIMQVSADFLRLCGLNPWLGRGFTPADELPNAPKTAVLAGPFWQRRFAADSHVIGQRLTLNGERYEIIGVLGEARGQGQIAEQSLGSGDVAVNRPPDVYLPMPLEANSIDRSHYFNVAGRLRPGVTLAAANAQLQSSYPEYARQWPGLTPGADFGVEPLQDAVVRGVRSWLLILQGAVGFVLLIACVNVANLLLARAHGRRREMAIRVASGAGWWRIVRQLLTESLMLSLAAAGLGLGLGSAGMRAILSALPAGLPRIGPDGENVTLDWRVVAFTIVLSILTAVLFGLAPALESARTDLSGALKERGTRGGMSLRHRRTRSWFVATEMALALVLLIGAALWIRSLVAIHRVDPGFDARDVLTLRVSLAGPPFDRPGAVNRVIQESLRRVRRLPGVEAAAMTSCLPLEDRWRTAFQIAGRPPESAQGVAGWSLVSAGFFEAFRIPVLRGRAFTEHDEIGPPVAIINQALARRLWPDGDPLRDRIVIGKAAPRQIIGVVGDVRDDALIHDPRPMLYELSAEASSTRVLTTEPVAWVIRSRPGSQPMMTAVEQELRAATGGLPIADVRTMQEILFRSTAAESFRTLVLAIFGFSALLLAAIGIYGLMADSVAARVSEIGVRMALGAESREIRTMVLLQGMLPAVLGAAFGLLVALGLARGFSSLLFGVKAWDPVVFVGAPVILLMVAFTGVWLPALRASRVDPLRALRCE